MIDKLIGQTLAGKYRIEQRWREDATSKTYHAIQTLIDKPVTLKVLNPALAEFPEVVSGFQMEARTLSRIANPHILNVLDFGTNENRLPFLVLEAAEGQTLREFIRSEGGSPIDRAANIVRQIADGLTAAHSNNVVHSSLSADKILISQRGNSEFVKILDFGAANSDDADDEKTVIRAELPFYKSPEQLQGGDEDSRSDVYALGVLLFEILTGKPPFTGDNAAVLASKHLNEIPPSLIAARPDLPPTIEQVVQRALAKNPNQRFQTPTEFAEALANSTRSGFAAHAAAGNFTDVPTRSTPPVEPANNPYKTAFIVLAGIMLLSVGGIYMTGGFRNTPTQQMNTDPNSQPVQPINPSTGVEDLGNMPIPMGNNDFNANGAYPGGIPPIGGGGIPPGIYGSGGNGNTYIAPNENSPFNNSNFNANTSITNTRPNSNTGNANTRPNTNIGNVNTRPTNTKPSPAPSVAPSAAPAQTPKPTQKPPTKPPANNALINPNG